MSTQDKLAEALRDAEATVLAFLGDVAFDGSVCGIKQAIVKGMFARLQAHAAEPAQDAKDADTTDQTAIVDSAGNIKYVHVEIFNAMKARAEEAEAMFFKATQDAMAKESGR